MLVKTLDLDVVPGKERKKIWLSQNDENFALVFKLYARYGELTIEPGTTVKINGKTSDGTAYTADASIVGKTVTVEGDGAMTAVPGDGLFEIELTHGDKRISTENFIIRIESPARST